MSTPDASSAIPHGLRYRPDIDGLRALAVSAVLLFHYRAPGFAGGFVGVDVFFVISGFLITTLVSEELDTGRFSLTAFYARRVRRIFPALFAMLAVATIVAAILLFPADFRRYAKTLLATALFGTNIELLRESGYFEAAAVTQPLLHLWSIAVEEQFYLLFPALLMLLAGRSRRAGLVLVAALFAASLSFAEWAVWHRPEWAFYLLPARMWELMAGALLALARLPQPRGGGIADAAGAVGLALIAVAVFSFDKSTRFPGLHALYPVGGAALLIWSGSGGRGRIAQLFSLKPLVGLGLISYSLYLWHWPVYVFANDALYGHVSPLAAAFCAVLSLLLAAASYHFIEKPFRRPRAGAPRSLRRPLAYGALAIAVTLAGSASVVAADGFPQRFGPQVARILREEFDDDGLLDTCFGIDPGKVDARHLCRIGAGPAVAPSFLLWGDSHADAILPAVRDIAAREGREGFFAGSPSCAPLLGLRRPDAPDCHAFNDRVLAFLRAHPELKTVILEARWGKNAEGTAYGDEGHGFVPIADDLGRSRLPSENAAIFTRDLNATVAALRGMGRQVVLIGPVPVVGWTVPIVLARRALDGKPPLPGPSAQEYRRRERVVLPLFAALAAQPGVRAFYPGDVFCRSGTCQIEENGIPFYRDEHHLSVFGAKQLEPLLGHLFDESGATSSAAAPPQG